MALARTTVANYKVRLKKLREILPLITDDEKKRKCLNEIESLTNKLGKELTDLELQLTRGPGRPKLREDYSAEFALAKSLREKEMAAGKAKEGPDFSKEGIERRAKYLREHPVTLVEEVERSAEQLRELIALNTQVDKEASAHDELVRKANEEVVTKPKGDTDGKQGPRTTDPVEGTGQVDQRKEG